MRRLALPCLLTLAFALCSCAQPVEEGGLVVDYQGRERNDPSPVAPFGELRMRHLRPEEVARRGPMLVADSSASGKSHFVRMVRFSSEEQNWYVMDHDTAYSRDIYTGTDWYITGAQNGDVWNVSFTMPNGSVISGIGLRYVDSLGSDTQCFLSGLSRLCGSDGVFVSSYFSSQCGATGAVAIAFEENGTTWGRDTFYLKNQIRDSIVPRGNQVAYATDAYDNQCKRVGVNGKYVSCVRDSTGALKPGYTAVPIQDLGCALTTAVNTLTYFGATTDPATLNTWMKANGGYTAGGGINWPAIGVYSRSINHDIGSPYYFAVDSPPTQIQYDSALTMLRTQICRYGLPSVRVKHGTNNTQQHWVSVYGRKLDSTTYLMSDPNGGALGFLSAYNNQPWKVVFWRRAAQPDPTHLGLTLLGPAPAETAPTPTSGTRRTALAAGEANSLPAEFLITDPLGRRLGSDPTTGRQYHEIPDAAYSTEYLSADVDVEGGSTQPSRELAIPHPVAGSYRMLVFGTDAGAYDLSLQAIYQGDETGSASVPETPTWAGAVHAYAFTYAPAGGSTTTLDQGSFTGGGQSAEADGLITYSVPGAKSTTVPSGVTGVPITLYLSPDVVASSVQLLWNGQNVTPLGVQAGAAVRLLLPVASGRNIFLASADGVIAGRPKADQDRLVFLAP